MREITFQVETDKEVGGFVASWDDAPGLGGITTEGDSLEELLRMIRDAIEGYFEHDKPTAFRLHFVEDPVAAVSNELAS